MEEKVIYKERIEWCDIYKGLLMMLVVIGHTTGIFNRYIYQFHMAAFFVISGYTSSIDKRDFCHFVFDKFYKNMVPYYFLGVSGNLMFYILSRINVLDKVSTTVYSLSLQQAMLTLFSKNAFIYCDWLGAIWFLPVLFFASIWAKIIFSIAKKKIKWMFVFSVLVFAISENSLMTGNHIIVLSGLAQFYFIMGILLSRALGKYDRSEKSVKYTMTFAVVVCCLWFLCTNNFIRMGVDWPSKQFNGTLKDILLPIFGITVTYIFAHLLTKFPITNRLFSYIGKNTMGIMSFHFVGFKVAYIFLILLGKMEEDEFNLLTPPTEVGNRYWFIIVVISICCSLFLWKGLNKIKVVSFLLGNSRVTINGKLGKGIEGVIEFFSDTFKRVWTRIDKRIYNCIYLVIVVIFILFLAKNVMKSLNSISITFPDISSKVDFENGWLLQDESENYRWVEKVSSFRVFLTNQTELHLEGYVPDSIMDMSRVAIYINDCIVLEEDLSSGEGFVYDILISEHVKKNAENEIRIEFDGSRVPSETDGDQRIFSALISAIEIR